MTPAPAYKRYFLVAMTSVYTLNLVDRTLMTLLLQPIKEDLKLSDTQLGFLTGIVFGLFYVVLGIPFGRWADRGNRVTITSLAIGLWGMTVMACLFVANFSQLAFARVAAAVGESGCKPPTYSLLGDYFPDPIERTRAMTIYIAGGPGSMLVGFIVGGWLNQLYGWRITFFLVGTLGLILAALVKATIIEPRTSATGPRTQEVALPAMGVVLTTLWQQRSFRHLSLALISLYIMSMGLFPWYAAFMVRSHGMATAELGTWLGLITGLSGIAGALIGGYVASHWLADNEQGQMRMIALSVASLTPCFVAFLTLPQKYQALFALIPLMATFSIFQGPTFTLMQRLVPDEMRATMMAVVVLLTNLIGFGIGPQVVGVLSDLLVPVMREDSLRYAMLITSFIALWSSYHFWQVGQTVKQDLRMNADRAAARNPLVIQGKFEVTPL